jgi:hypothetical protein
MTRGRRRLEGEERCAIISPVMRDKHEPINVFGTFVLLCLLHTYHKSVNKTFSYFSVIILTQF